MTQEAIVTSCLVADTGSGGLGLALAFLICFVVGGMVVGAWFSLQN